MVGPVNRSRLRTAWVAVLVDGLQLITSPAEMTGPMAWVIEAGVDHAIASQRGMLVKIGSMKFARERCLHNIPFDLPQITVPKKPKAILHEDEIETFFGHLDKIANLHQQVMVRAMYLLGLRRFEASELRWDRYDERARTYTVVGKGGKVETLPVVEEMAEWFSKRPRLGECNYSITPGSSG